MTPGCWRDNERRLLEALAYCGVGITGNRGEPWVVCDAEHEDGAEDYGAGVLVLNVSELARALEFIK